MSGTENVVSKKADPEPSYRHAMRRAVKIAKGFRPLSAKTNGRLPPSSIDHMLKRNRVFDPRTAIIIEEALGGKVNRLEFFPELIHNNDDLLAVVAKMVRSERKPIR